MQSADISALHTLVLWATFLAALLFGGIAQRTHFCTMGAVSDIVNMQDWTRMRQWGLAAGVAMAGFALLVFAGTIDPSQVIYASKRLAWLSAAFGGFLFGLGMVLSSGCGSKTLVRLGGGSLKALVVLLVMGLAAFATIKGLTAVIRVATVDSVVLAMPSGSSLPDWLSATWGLPLPWTGLVLGLGTGAALILWALSGRGFLQTDNLLAGLGLGLIVTAMWWVTGSLGFVAEHPETLQETFLATNSGRIEALSFVAPVAHTLDWLLFFSDKNKQLSVGVVAVLGVLLGSCLCALAMKNFRWEGFAGTEDLANHLVGALLMGVGGVTAMGCTIGQGLSGLSTLSLSSFVALAAIMAGAVAGLRYQVWRLDRRA